MKTATMKQAIGDRCPSLISIIEMVECGQGYVDGNMIFVDGLYETGKRKALGLAARYPEYVCAKVTHDLRSVSISNICALIEEIRLGN